MPIRTLTVHTAGLGVAAGGCLLRFLVGQDASVLPKDALLVGAAALVVALLPWRWAPLLGIAAAAWAFTVPDAFVRAGAGVAVVAAVAAVARPLPRPSLRWVRWTAVGVLGLLVVATAAYAVRNSTYAGRDAAAVERAGFVERRATVGGVGLGYAEGPDNGPPLLLVHGQVTDWRSWSRVLPGLAERFHVFAVDCPGHGASDRMPEYAARGLVAVVAGFVQQVVGEPAVVVGHSSGGLIAAGLAADAPELVRAVVLEDPPLFSSVPPRSHRTYHHVDLATAAQGFLRSGGTDFTTYYVEHTAMWGLFGAGGANVREQALRHRAERPDEAPMGLWFLPPSIREPFRAVPAYDPRFGAAFHDGSFQRGFDHADVLRRIAVPTVLVHAGWTYDDDGVLLGAMDADDAGRARSLLRDASFHEVDTGHGFHVEDPERFLDIVLPLSG